ncbi:ubiquitin hydrolase [Reticulomyxa filosa]|uniref:Ubiquitin hydrolase n=1 Tax=Reticulomyxa filosa TaxID=46433 RepID=X6LTV7_RETFI|nr:ubiquitin hydrolase [Reticulomyxa filosa]|eukprot:ETO04801.1 ubiquitin hydrolase [Reticulomyxa filosa]
MSATDKPKEVRRVRKKVKQYEDKKVADQEIMLSLRGLKFIPLSSKTNIGTLTPTLFLMFSKKKKKMKKWKMKIYRKSRIQNKSQNKNKSKSNNKSKSENATISNGGYSSPNTKSINNNNSNNNKRGCNNKYKYEIAFDKDGGNTRIIICLFCLVLFLIYLFFLVIFCAYGFQYYGLCLYFPLVNISINKTRHNKYTNTVDEFMFMSLCNSIQSLFPYCCQHSKINERYLYLCINDYIILFGDANGLISIETIYIYSTSKYAWIKSQHSLPNCVANSKQLYCQGNAVNLSTIFLFTTTDML